MNKIDLRTLAGRLLIGMVLFLNVQCAIAFISMPGSYTAGFELSGAVGNGMVQGMGILFLMWNVPYAVAFANPLRYRISLYEAVVMQAIGFAGETLLLVTFPAGHPMIEETVRRFILFDGAGLCALLLAVLVTRRRTSPNQIMPHNRMGA